MIARAAGLALLALLCACQTITVGENAQRSTEAGPGIPPRTLAILPTSDLSGENPDISAQLRQSLFGATAPLPFDDIDLSQVDARLSMRASGLNMVPERMTSDMQADPSVADLVLFSEIERVSNLYLLLYAQLKIEIKTALVDTRTRRVLYRNTFTTYDRLGGPAFTVLGLLEPIMVGVVGRRPRTLEQTLDSAARHIVEEFPVLPSDLASANRLRLMDVQVGLPTRTLRTGQVITVRAIATPGLRASFAVGNQPSRAILRETTPGTYEGAYEASPGDDTAYGIVELTLESSDGVEKLTYAATKSPFSIDTIPPQRAQIARWWPDDESLQGIFLEMESIPSGSASAEPPRQYLIFRRDAEQSGEGEFDFLGSSAQPVYRDGTTQRGRQYDYRVTTMDAAGNQAQPADPVRVRVQ